MSEERNAPAERKKVEKKKWEERIKNQGWVIEAAVRGGKVKSLEVESAYYPLAHLGYWNYVKEVFEITFRSRTEVRVKHFYVRDGWGGSGREDCCSRTERFLSEPWFGSLAELERSVSEGGVASTAWRIICEVGGCEDELWWEDVRLEEEEEWDEEEEEWEEEWE